MSAYSKVSHRLEVWNSRGGWKKHQELIVLGVGIIGGFKKTEKRNNPGVG